MFDLVQKGLSYEGKLEQIVKWIEEADAVVIGGASGMSTANGFDYYTPNSPFFQEHFADLGEVYHESSAWQLLYHSYNSPEERWGSLCRGGVTMIDLPVGETYKDLHKIIGDKDHFIVTTNQDTQFAKIFDPEKIFTVQGDAHWLQCANRCHDKIYPADDILHKMNDATVNGVLPTELLPLCPVCGEVMEPWIKSYVFQYGSYWQEQADKYKEYLTKHVRKNVLFLALGVGNMTPEFIKEPFMNMTYNWPNARLALLNIGEPEPLEQIADKTITLNADIKRSLKDLLKLVEAKAVKA